MYSTTNTEFELLLAELQELRLAVAELNCKTDKVIREVTGLTLRVDSLKLDKLVIDKLEVSGIELQLKFGAGGNDDDCNSNR